MVMSDWDDLEVESLEKHIRNWALQGVPQERVPIRSRTFPSNIVRLAHDIHRYCEVTKINRAGNSYITQPNMTEVWHGMMSCGLHYVKQWPEYLRWQTINRAITSREINVPQSIVSNRRTLSIGYQSVESCTMSISANLSGEISDVAWDMHTTMCSAIPIIAVASVIESEVWVEVFSPEYIREAKKAVKAIRGYLGEEIHGFGGLP